VESSWHELAKIRLTNPFAGGDASTWRVSLTVFLYSGIVKDLVIDKLSDEFGQYTLLIECSCGHARRCYPNTLASFAGWDGKLADVMKRMRCSECGEKKCKARVCSFSDFWTKG
jgi:hypothetical protein